MAHDKRARNKQRQLFQRQKMQSPVWQMREGARWPITSCLTVGDWHSPGALIQMLLTRTRHPEDPASRTALGVYLIDTGCLGLKNTYGLIATPEKRQTLIDRIQGPGVILETDPGVALMVLQAAIEYARSFGFEPQADFRHTAAMWLGVTPAPRDPDLVLGDGKGKPFFISGPHDDVGAITRQLANRVGPDGFANMIATDGMIDVDDDDDVDAADDET